MDVRPSNFIKNIINQDLASNKHQGLVHTRFPPEPNGYLHIGHAKSICLNFGLAQSYHGKCNLRFDDTNPEKEEQEYVDAIIADIRWLGYDWEDRLYFASDYFEELYLFAVQLIKRQKAYVCDLPLDEIKKYRGTLTEAGTNSPYRERSVAENLDLFAQMRAGAFADGSRTLRAKIDMASPNINMRDPIIYRIRRTTHHRTGDQWCIYPMYDFTHCLSDMLEKITHSICTLEFEDHRPLYDWFLDELQTPCHPQQIEFARLNLSYTVLSKRRLIQLVTAKIVQGWDDPRMPTISGLRRRGYTPSSIREFCERIGLAKRDSMVDLALLEFCIREELNPSVPRLMAIIDPIKVVITNYPEGQVEQLDCPLLPEDSSLGNRPVNFGREIYLEREDFAEYPPKKFFRLAPGQEVRLRYAYYITCQQVVKNTAGEIVEIHCTYDPLTKGGSSPDGRKVKGTLHWVHAPSSVPLKTRLYETLFTVENPQAEENYLHFFNNQSLREVTAHAEPALQNYLPGERVQFERLGYFYADHVDSRPGNPVYHRIVTLKDTWAKIQKKGDE